MQCTTCGANLPPGAASCPLCRTPTPYNVAGSGNSPQYDPTVIAPQPQYGGTPYGSGGQPPIDPTVVTPSYGGTPPPTAYGTPSYGAPPPPPGQNPYDAAPVNPYSAPTAPQYGVPPVQQGAYGTPPMQGAYGQPPQPVPGGYGYNGTPPKRRSRVGLIVAIVLAVVLLACVGISVFIYQAAKTGIDTVSATVTAAVSTVTAIPTTDITPTTSTSTGSPSGQSIDPTAAGIISNIQMASAIDTKTAVATKLATTFTPQQTVYATVTLNMGGQTGYAQAKWYGDGTLIRTSKVLDINSASYTNAYFYFSYTTATQGAVEVYWCTQSDCSDAQLAATTTFTVSATSFHWQNQPPTALSDINRP